MARICSGKVLGNHITVYKLHQIDEIGSRRVDGLAVAAIAERQFTEQVLVARNVPQVIFDGCAQVANFGPVEATRKHIQDGAHYARCTDNGHVGLLIILGSRGPVEFGCFDKIIQRYGCNMESRMVTRRHDFLGIGHILGKGIDTLLSFHIAEHHRFFGSRKPIQIEEFQIFAIVFVLQ